MFSISRKAAEISSWVCASDVIRFTSGLFHHRTCGNGAVRDTYADNGRVNGNWRRFVLLDRGCFFDPQILDIGAAKHNVLVELVRGSNFFFRFALASFGSERLDVFERDGRFVRVDLMECADIAIVVTGQLRPRQRVRGGGGG